MVEELTPAKPAERAAADAVARAAAGAAAAPSAARAAAPVANPLLQLMALARRARRAGSAEELLFMAVNDSRALAAYRQAALWLHGSGVKALSGVVEPEANAPYAQWLERLCRHLAPLHREPAVITAIQLPAELASEWNDWLPPHALWLPLPAAGSAATVPAQTNTEPQAHATVSGGLLLAADAPWPDAAVALMAEWLDAWHHAWQARAQADAGAWRQLKQALGITRPLGTRVRWWQRRRLLAAAAIAALLCVPVRLSVLAPGELVPAHPAVIRAPLDGVIGQFLVQPNQRVKAGEPLFVFDEAGIAARHEVAAQALAAAQAEYRQYAQQALSDTRSKTQLALLQGKIEEKRAEAEYLKGQFERSTVLAPQDGVALFDDATEWIGKPVQTGERILRIAAPGDVEVEAWLPIGDAIALPERAVAQLYLATDPLAALPAQVRYIAHDAVLRPDNTYAYRVRARLDAATAQRVGLKGTVKISGDSVPLAYWMLRRPLATVRQTLGL